MHEDVDRAGVALGVRRRSAGQRDAPMKRYWVLAAYVYSALHIVSWRILLSSNGHESWERPFSMFFGLIFLPLNLLAGGMCRAVWGTSNIFHARYIFGIVLDVAVASMSSVTIVVICANAFLRRREYLKSTTSPGTG